MFKNLHIYNNIYIFALALISLLYAEGTRTYFECYR